MESSPTFNEKIFNLILSYYNLEKERENFLKNEKNELFQKNKKVYYLIDELWINNFKKLINYDKIVSNLKEKQNEENIINEYIEKELNNLNDHDISSLIGSKNNYKNTVIKELIEKNKFPFEIINEETKNALDLYKVKMLEICGAFSKDNKIFYLSGISFNDKSIIIFFFHENNFLYKIFIVIDKLIENHVIEKIKGLSYKQILNYFKINLNNIKQNNETNKIDLENKYNCNIIIKKLNNANTNIIFKNNINTIVNNKKKEDLILINLNNQNEISMSHTVYQKFNPNHEIIKEIFKNFLKSNELYTNALENDDTIRENYSPCKLISLKWVTSFLRFFQYDSKNITVLIEKDIILKNSEIFNDFKKLYPNNIENGGFFICNEIFFYTIIQFFEKEKQKELEKNCLECEIFLRKDKGAIIIKNEIYIFKILNNLVNKREDFKKINCPKKNELLKKMLDTEYELDDMNWEELNSYTKVNNNIINKDENNMIMNNNIHKNIIINKDDNNIIMNDNNINDNAINKKENMILNNNNTNLINQHINDNKNVNFNNQNINKIIEPGNNNFINNININNNIIINENQIKNLLLSLFNKQKELDERKKKLDKMEQDLIFLKKITLDKTLPTIGLQNIGSTCYMNATLQCIAHFIEVSEEILTWYKYGNDKNKKSKILSYEYAEILDNLFFPKDKKNYFEPKKFKELISKQNQLFAGNNPNDSKDLLNYLIETMHNELNELGENKNNNFDENLVVDQTNEYAILNYFKGFFSKNYHSIFSKYLYGIQKTITKCCKCYTSIYNFQTYNFLIFPLLDVKNYVLMNNFASGNIFFAFQNYILNLYDCFNYYQKIDFFTGQNCIHCNKCNSLQNANYCSLLYSVPTILSIVLNRGKDNADFKEKFNICMELNLMNYVAENQNNANYYLIGVVCHVGNNLNGHFFAYCRSDIRSPWYKYNDALVGQSNEKEILNAATPYILFYHRYN